MDETFDSGFELNEGAEVCVAGDGAADTVTDLVLAGDGVPGVGVELLEAEGDLAGGGIDLEDFDFELLADGEDVGGVGDAVPGDVGDVEEAVGAADVDEGTVVGEGADGAGDGVAFVDLGEAAVFGGALLFFHDGAAVHDYVGSFIVLFFELGDADLDLLAYELLCFGGVARAAAGGGHEGANAYIDGEAALDGGSDGASDDGFGGKSFFEGGEVPGLRDLEEGELIVAVFVAAFDGDEEVVAEGGRGGEGGEGEDAFGLVADVEEDGVCGDGGDGGVDLLAPAFGGGGVALIVLLEQGVERLGGFGDFDGLGGFGGDGIGHVGHKWAAFILSHGRGGALPCPEL